MAAPQSQFAEVLAANFGDPPLRLIAEAIMRDFSALELSRRRSRTGEDFLHLCPRWVGARLTFLPTFHLIAKARQNTDMKTYAFPAPPSPSSDAYLDPAAWSHITVVLTLTNFCGKTLQTEALAVTELSSSRLLYALSSDSFALCKGVDVNNVSKGNALNLIREYVEDELVVRSKDCKYVIMLSEAQPGQTDCCKSCMECMTKSSKVTASKPFATPSKEAARRGTRGGSASPATSRKSASSSAAQEQCSFCGRVYKSRQPYLKHLKKCGLKEDSAKDSSDGGLAASVYGDDAPRCSLCLRRFENSKQLDRHIAFHREKHKDLDSAVVCPWSTCGMRVSKMELNTHFLAAHDETKGVCVECLEVVDANSLRRHVYNRHFYSVKDRLCPTCGESFSSPLKLRVHISSAHDSTGTAVVCEQCGKVFPHPIKLSHHIYHHHNTTRRYPCHSCDKVFMNPMNYYKHVKIHSSVKPFFCCVCGYRAVRKDNVQQHVRKVHKIETPGEQHVGKDGDFVYEALERHRRRADSLEALAVADVIDNLNVGEAGAGAGANGGGGGDEPIDNTLFLIGQELGLNMN